MATRKFVDPVTFLLGLSIECTDTTKEDSVTLSCNQGFYCVQTYIGASDRT